MRILQVSSATNLGGGETHFIELVDKLRQLGHEVIVAGRRNGPLQTDVVLPFLNSADFVSAFRLRTILKSKRIDVVHAHVARDYTVVAAAAWGLRDVRVVFTRHLLYPVKKHALYRRVDGWLAPTSKILQAIEHLKPKRSAVIPNWVDINKFTFVPHELHSPACIGLLGQISPHKGHEDALGAVRLLGSGFRLLIAGRGEPEYVKTIKRQAAGLPVDFLGFVSLPEFFAMVDVLAVPSWEEPFGIVLLEAMASGVPVVSTACGGPLEIIGNDCHGILVPSRDPVSLSRALRVLTEDSDMRTRIIRAARERVEQEYDIAKVVPRVVAFYAEVLSANRS